MAERLQLDSPPINPVYSQTQPGQPIHLGQVPIQFADKAAMANVTIRFLPDNRLEFICPFDGESPLSTWKSMFDVGRQEKLTLTETGVTFEAFCQAFCEDGFHLVPTTSGIIATPPSKTISAVTFHLFNFPDFGGPEDYILKTGNPPLQGGRVCGRAVLKKGPWIITVAGHDQTDNLTKMLNAQGGFALTHVGQIVRDDGATFTSEEIGDLLTCLHYFLSFVLGRWVGLALPVGFDPDGKKVFEEWGLRITADGAWNGSTSWFDLHHGELLSQVFPGFMSLWTNKLWHTPLTSALYWYLGACDRRVGIGVDTGLILAQTALELLAWTLCVLDRKMVSSRAFERRGGLSAADKLRLLASFLGIPQEIPPHFSALHGRPGKKWPNAMDAITAIRNSLVHPVALTNLPENSYYEAWSLSLWYIDLVLLRLCGHHGKYANRLSEERRTGQVESVPWA